MKGARVEDIIIKNIFAEVVTILVPIKVMKKAFSIIKNKYLITLVALLVWLSFFDKNDFSTQRDLSLKVSKLQGERDYYIKAIETNKREIRELQTDSNNLEKFARENYLMKRDNEDVFVIVKK